ncbi:hypothetical protein FUAX_51320 (plasmid) [Fulvitalea axinellae]|uniref:Uncharacterized protein YyaB-like PH domain-containing protein n=1 Tax=Fulvitalea axinellae TaxID=1182444 RepID=A0AAU9DNE4_9BACT|nr:hypothetical protein FUAX_51320 [Fulvitalea axinellae]
MGTKVFKSKVDFWLFAPVFAILAYTSVLPFWKSGFSTDALIASSVSVSSAVFVIHLFKTTVYRITDNGRLSVKCSFLINEDILVSDIKEIHKSHNPLSSPAMSLDRIKVIYGNDHYILLSPEDKRLFVAELLKINPKIKYTL